MIMVNMYRSVRNTIIYLARRRYGRRYCWILIEIRASLKNCSPTGKTLSKYTSNKKSLSVIIVADQYPNTIQDNSSTENKYKNTVRNKTDQSRWDLKAMCS